MTYQITEQEYLQYKNSYKHKSYITSYKFLPNQKKINTTWNDGRTMVMNIDMEKDMMKNYVMCCEYSKRLKLPFGISSMYLRWKNLYPFKPPDVDGVIYNGVKMDMKMFSLIQHMLSHK